MSRHDLRYCNGCIDGYENVSGEKTRHEMMLLIYIRDVINILPYANQHASCRSQVRAVGSEDRWPTNELGQVDSNAQRVRVLSE